MWRAALKGVFAHKVRLALTAVAIVAGVAFVSGTFVLTDTLQQSFDDLFGTLSAGIDVQVRAKADFTGQQSFFETRDRIPEALLDDINALPQVGAATGTVGGYAQFLDKAGKAISPQAPTLGVSVASDPSLDTATIRAGRAPAGPDEVAMDEGTAADNGFAVGDRVTILFLESRGEFTLVGTFGFDELDSLLGATVAAFDLPTAQAVLDAEGEFDTIDIAGAEGVSQTQLASAVTAVIPDTFEAITQDTLVAEQSQDVSEGFLSIFNVVLLVFAGIAVFVGAFIIANTFSIIVAQRLREMALLRAIGATGGQVTRMVLVETLLVAVVASVIGLFAGIGVAVGLKALLSGFGIDLPAASIVFRLRTAIVGLGVGIIVTVLAALWPARTASRIPPIAALSERYEIQQTSLRKAWYFGLPMAGIGIVLLFLGLFGVIENGLASVGFGALLIFLGVTVLSPIFAGRMARIIGFPARRMFGMTGKLARENAGRRPRRTAATASALMIGLALVSFALIFGNSLKVSTGEVIADSLSADFIVTPSGFQPFSPVIGRDMAALPEIAVATGVSSGEFRLDGVGRFLGGVDPAVIDQVSNLDVLAGSLADLTRGTIMVHTDVAETNGWNVGDTLNAEFARTGIVPLRIAAIYEAETALIGEFNISRETYADNYRDVLDQVVLANAAPGTAVEDARSALQTVVDRYPVVEIENQAEFRQATEDQINQLLGIVTAMLGLALLIALLGITNTLALSVYERTREIGLLRSIGMTRRQVRSMIGFEAVIVSLFGALMGLAIGTFFGWAVVRAAADQGFSTFAPPIGTLVVMLVLATIAGVIAAASPARTAAKMNMLEAISYE